MKTIERIKDEKTMPKKPKVYYLQNQAIHRARAQLEENGVLYPWTGLAQVRDMAADLNHGLRSISKLSIKQREALIEKLKGMGAHVKNPHIYPSDLEEERRLSGSKEPRKVVLFNIVGEGAQRMLDAVAAKIRWRAPDGYKALCLKLIGSPVPRNAREVTKLRLALQSILDQQLKARASEVNFSHTDDPDPTV